MALHSQMGARGVDDKPLPSLPSPTLTNPDMVLPDEGPLPSLPSPARTRRPPSPSYLRDKTNEYAGSQAARAREQNPQHQHQYPYRQHYQSQDQSQDQQHREKRGLMSRKMMLMRSHTGSGMQQPRAASREAEHENSPAAPSSPLLPDRFKSDGMRKERRNSLGASSLDSDELASMPEFLSKYRNVESTDDDFTDGESTVPGQWRGYDEVDAQRRAAEEEEQASALLSQRAEQILANAKKRLNLMEGNLRGARDLVAPLTAANLKRAASLGSSTGTSSLTYAQRRLESMNTDDEQAGRDGGRARQHHRILHSQTSSPVMKRDYFGHARGFSETELPERPHTSVARVGTFVKPGRIPVKPSEPSRSGGLRASRSFESLGGGDNSPAHAPDRERQRGVKGSPDPDLEAMPEDGGSQLATSPRFGLHALQTHGIAGGLGPGAAQADSPTTGHLREQMSTLNRKISSLKERAREDSLRRQSMNNMRTPSPLNNAMHHAPEFWYSDSSASGGDRQREANAGAGLGYSSESSPATAQASKAPWQSSGSGSGAARGRNAFAEQTSARPSSRKAPSRNGTGEASTHTRTASGTAVVHSANMRYSHHRHPSGGHSRDVPGSFYAYESEDSGSETDYPQDSTDEGMVSPLSEGESLTPDYGYEVSGQEAEEDEREGSVYEEDEREGSVYEDAAPEQAGGVVAHEDREDAFDYEHFFLHSAMGSYQSGRDSETSDDNGNDDDDDDDDDEDDGDTASVSSVGSAETAKAPRRHAADYEDMPPPTPSTPQALLDIERRLQHSRTLSDESISTLDTFATADEGAADSRRTSRMDWPIPPSAAAAVTPAIEAGGRPSTAVPRNNAAGPTPALMPTESADDGSDRADSGVGGLDPAAAAARALLDPAAKALGLKDRAVLFGVLESVRRTCARLQQEDEDQYECRVLRRRLDDARRLLDGLEPGEAH